MILCLDSGNSRLKYGLCAPAGSESPWLIQGALAHDATSRLPDLLAAYPKPERILLANVAGPAAEARIRAALRTGVNVEMEVVRSGEQACGVSNLYQNPARLGVDRWCALIGARAQCSGALLVVMAGTATTIDSLDPMGNFLGGLILPGQHLMLSALARDTADLPFAKGQHQHFPRCTEDAIVSGALEAQIGAIQRAWARLPGPRGACLLSGGNAGLLAKHLDLEHPCLDNLPLLGLRQVALSPCTT
jgi:type III pantothenate kinase